MNQIEKKKARLIREQLLAPPLNSSIIEAYVTYISVPKKYQQIYIIIIIRYLV